MEEIEKNLSGIQTADEDDLNEVQNVSVSDDTQILSENMEQSAIIEETREADQNNDQLETLHETEN